MEKAPELIEWGFISPSGDHAARPATDPEGNVPRRKRHSFTLVDERGREITARATETGEADVEVHRRAFPWTLFSVALLAGAVTGAAVGAAWTIVPPLAETPALEASRSHESSEIWSEAAGHQALARARALLGVPDESPKKVIHDAAPASGIKLPSPAPGAEDAASDNPY